MRWISVKDKKPDFDCIACFNDGTVRQIHGLCTICLKDGRTIYIEDEFLDFAIDWIYYVDSFEPNITHWMPLPEPPKEK